MVRKPDRQPKASAWPLLAALLPLSAGSAALVLSAGSAALAQTCDLGRAPAVPVVKGLSYAAARQAILAGGWQPVQGHPHNDLSSNEQTFRERGFTELQFCRITADSYCRFQYAAGPVALWVVTLGEENAALDSHAEVKSAKLGCVGAAAPE